MLDDLKTGLRAFINHAHLDIWESPDFLNNFHVEKVYRVLVQVPSQEPNKISTNKILFTVL